MWVEETYDYQTRSISHPIISCVMYGIVKQRNLIAMITQVCRRSQIKQGADKVVRRTWESICEFSHECVSFTRLYEHMSEATPLLSMIREYNKHSKVHMRTHERQAKNMALRITGWYDQRVISSNATTRHLHRRPHWMQGSRAHTEDAHRRWHWHTLDLLLGYCPNRRIQS